ncbi:aminotransferase [Desulfomarina profundi]|uniref:Aminotransferase n=1 Tax=Desulfomarina profundi TaxID=2772557 RepID=A0A8D5JHQ5_9BACT|nr:pyridoxal phosphate-dependent aminotransferase [Desulfomarina profundi]BCL61759.1 aminotransferase [Desulfomarina profundi]
MNDNSNYSRHVPVSRRVRDISPSATKEMANLAAKTGGCVSLGQGVPSFATPDHIVAAVTEIMHSDPASGKYTLQSGMIQLRECIAGYLLQEKNISVNPENEICVTVGGMEALLTTIFTVIDPGDEIILPSPTYASYIEQVLLAGGIPKFVPLTRDWGLDLPAIRQAVNPKTKAVMLCNPGNPTGTVFSDDQTMELGRMAVDCNFVIITDEAYDYILYSNETLTSLLGLKTMREHIISVFSLSKKYALTGWRIGWVAADQRWMEQIMKVHDATTICAPTPSQFAALVALEGDQECVTHMRNALVRRRTLCCSRLDGLSEYFSYVPPKGAFYVMAKYLFSDSPSREVATRLLQEAKVITVPGGSFGPGGEGHLRLSFGGKSDEINEAFDRIERWLVRFG